MEPLRRRLELVQSRILANLVAEPRLQLGTRTLRAQARVHALGMIYYFVDESGLSNEPPRHLKRIPIYDQQVSLLPHASSVSCQLHQ